ncbi:MAG: choice-of-anchor J domain-containing protein [Akkermansiaceae bacterium]|nr:choice-of-anchor J domain-containing protein [Akkermansiaceae bacterium]
MKKRIITLFTAFAAAAALAPTAQADVITIPGDGYEGPYRLLFVTTATTDATSSDLTGVYNPIAQTAGDTVLAGQTWTAVVGSSTVSARTHTGALAVGDTGYALGTNDVPIYTTNGLRVLDGNAGLWAGSFDTVLKNQTGGAPSFNQTIHVGYLAGGDIRANQANNGPVGNTLGKVAGAIATRTGTTNMYQHNNDATTATPLFALSGVINAPPAPRVAPEITSFTSLGSGNFELTLKGDVSTGYEFRSSPILDFTPGDLVGPLTAVAPLVGTIDGTNNSVLITDENGDGTVQMALSGPSNFVRARIPPLLEENFDAAGPGLPAGWVTVNDPVSATTVWDVGDPSDLPYLQNGNGTNCVGTNVMGDFAHEDATVTLTSPPVSIPAGGATLSFRQYIDSDTPDVGAVRLLDASGAEISGGAFPVTGFNGVEEGWTNESYQLPDLARGKTVRVVFEFKTNAVDNFDTKGFYIDDVFVTGN